MLVSQMSSFPDQCKDKKSMYVPLYPIILLSCFVKGLCYLYEEKKWQLLSVIATVISFLIVWIEFFSSFVCSYWNAVG